MQAEISRYQDIATGITSGHVIGRTLRWPVVGFNLMIVLIRRGGIVRIQRDIGHWNVRQER